jgi:hypothetical protein
MVEVLLGSGQMLLYSPLLAQVNVGSPQAVFLGLMIASSGAGLYFLRSFRPELARDHDIFFAAIALLCGGIVFFNGWRLDPILLFSQILLGGSAIFFAVESIRLRGIATDQARRNTPIVDNDRPVGRVYRAELDELAPSDQVPSVRRIRSARDSSADEDIYARERLGESRSSRRPRRSRSSSESRQQGFDRGETRRPRRRSAESSTDRRSAESDDNSTYSRRYRSGIEDPYASAPEESRRRSRRTSASSSSSSEPTSRRRRPRGASESGQRDDYVDYRPVDYRSSSNRGSYDAPTDDEWA